MATLTKVTGETKFIIKWGIITSISFLLIFFGIRFVTIVKEILYPAPPTPPTVSFGKLIPIKFPQNTTDKSFTFTVDTLSGKLPEFQNRINVYRITPNKPDFLSLEKAQNKASVLGFNNKKDLVQENTYQWIDEEETLKKISFNIVSSDFTYSTSFITDTNTNSRINLPNSSEAINIAKTFLNRLSSFPEDIDETKTKTSLYDILDYALTPAQKTSNAQIIKVDFFQKSIDNLPIYYENAMSSAISLLIKGEENPKVAEASFYHKNISKESGTYPIKSAEQAFSELKKGQAYISAYSENKSNVLIKNVYLGYYLGKNEQEYLMPIIIFEGNNDFFAYVSAVKDEWMRN